MYIPKTLPLLSHATVTKQQKPSAFAENTHTTTIPIITQYFKYVNNCFTYLKKMSNNRRNQKYPIDKWIFACYNKYEHQFTF